MSEPSRTQKDEGKTREQLIAELAELRQRATELEAAETKRKRAERELRESEEKYRTLVEQSLQGIFIAQGPPFRLVFVNPAAARIWGYTPEELMRLSPDEVFDLLHPEDRAAALRRFANVQEEKTPLSPHECRLIRKDGTVCWAEMFGRRIEYQGEPAFQVAILDITERKQAEEVLIIKEGAMSSAINGMAIAEFGGTLTYVNHSFLRLWGYADENEVLGKPAVGFWQSEDQAAQVIEALREGDAWTGELVAKRKDGSLFDVHLSANVVRDEAGKPIYMMSSFLDITERKQAAEALQESEKNLKEAQRIAHLGSWALDLGTNKFTVSEEMIRIYRYKDWYAGSVSMEEFAQHIYPDDRERVASALNDAIAGTAPYDLEFRVVRTDGEIRTLHAQGEVIRDEAGKPIRMVGTGLDITERKRAERGVRESEEKYRNLVEQANDGIAIVQDGLLRYANQRLAEMSRYTVEEVIDTPFTDYIHPDELPKVLDRYERRMAGETVTPIYESAIKHKDGHRIEVELNAGVTTYQGKPADLVIVRDITERKQAEAALRESKEQLELIYRLSRRLSESLDLHDVAQRALDDICAVVGALRGILLVRELDSDHLRLVAVSGYDAESVEALNRRVGTQVGKGLAGWVAVHQQPALVDDVTRDERWLLVPKLDDWVCSVLSVPLVSQDELVGVLSVYSEQESFFYDDHRRLVESAAAAVAAAITNARLYAQAQQRLQSLTNLNRASQAVTSSLDVKEVLAQIVDLTGSVVNSDYTSVALLGEEGQPVLGAEDFRGVPPLARRIRSSGTTRHVLDSGQPVVVDAISDDGTMSPPFRGADGELMAANPAIVTAGICSFAAVPIQAKGKTLGVLFVHSREPRTFHGQLPLLTTFANQAAVAIENAWLYEQAQQEIAERKQVEKALRESGLQYRTTIDSMGDSIHVIDSSLRFVLVNQAFKQWNKELGLETDTIGRTVFETFPFLPERVRDEYHQVFDTGKPLITEERTEIAGKAFITETRKVPIFEGKRVARVVTVIRDITERKQAENERMRLLAQIQGQARQVQQIMDTVPEGVLLLDADLRLLLANPAAREYLTVLTDAQVGNAPRPDSGMALTCLGNRPLTELLARPPKGLWHEVTVDGPPRQAFEVIAQPMAAEPEARGWVLVIRDITQEREIQKRVQQQARLAAVGQLAAGIAHDFNNLLTGMIGFAQLLRTRADVPGSAKADLARIVQEGQRAARLIRQILDFSRKSLRMPQLLDLAPFLKETAKFLERTIPENIRVVLEMVPGEYLVLADPTQIQQMLTNLAVNARDAMPEGGELQLCLSNFTLQPGERAPVPDMSPGEWVALSVVDTGTGIPLEVMPHLFEPFFTTKEVGEGTGLGLAQVYGIVKQHEGSINVASQVGIGTTFTIYLPAARAREEAASETTEEIPAGQGETILLVEDEAMVLDVIQAMLEQLEYRVLTATNGREALIVYEQYHDEIDLVLMDLIMPEMDGEALLQALRAQDPKVKVVAMTGYPLGGKYRQLLTQEVIDRIQKPMDHAQLAQVLRQTLG